MLQYVSALRTLATTCKFGASQDEMISDRLCMGLNETSTVMQLLKHPDLTLSKAIEIATLEESAQKDQQLLTAGKEAEVCAVWSTPSRGARVKYPAKQTKSPASMPKPCGRCGFTTHTGSQCPASGKTCKKCGKRGHFSTVCRSKSVEEIECQKSDQHEPGSARQVLPG